MFAISPDDWQGTVVAIVPYYDKAYVVLRDASISGGKESSQFRYMLGIRCWQSIEQLKFKVGDVVSATNLDVDGLSMLGYPCDDGDNGTKGTFKVIKEGKFSEKHKINYTYIPLWEYDDVKFRDFEDAMRKRLLELFPNSTVSIRESKDPSLTVCGGTGKKDFIRKGTLDEIARKVLSNLRRAKKRSIKE
jgi:hypothetical protein